MKALITVEIEWEPGVQANPLELVRTGDDFIYTVRGRSFDSVVSRIISLEQHQGHRQGMRPDCCSRIGCSIH